MAPFLPLLIWLSLLGLPLIFISALLWRVYGFTALFHLTYGVMDFCQSLFSSCAGYYQVIKLISLWTGALMLAGGLLYGIIKGVAGLVRANRSIKRLPLSKTAGSLVLIRDARSRAAFTYGLFRPRIYISTGLLDSLDRSELKTVFLHELHHKRRLDPLKFFLLTLIKDSFFYIPVVKYLVSRIRSRKEEEADNAAVACTNEPLSLASALVKVAVFHKEMAFMSVSITGDTEGGSVAARIRKLVDGKETEFKFPAIRTVAVSLFIIVFLSLSIAVPINAASPAPRECAKKQCEMHLNKQNNSLRNNHAKQHCKAMEHRH